MATKKKANKTLQGQAAESKYKALESKVRKLQKENRELRVQLVKEISRHMPDVNAPLVPVPESDFDSATSISTEVNTNEESTTEVNPEGGN